MNSQKLEYFNSLVTKNTQKSNQIAIFSRKSRERDVISMIDSLLIEGVNNNNGEKENPQKQKLKALKVNNSHLKIQVPQQDELVQNQKMERFLKKDQDQIVEMKQSIEKLISMRRQNQMALVDELNSLKRLKLEKQIAMGHRKQQELIRSIEQLRQNIKQKIKVYELHKIEKKNKLEMIQKRIELLQEQKFKRQEILSAKSLPMIPRYKIMEKKFLMADIKKELDQNVERRRLKELRYKNYIGLGNPSPFRSKRLRTQPKNVVGSQGSGSEVVLNKRELLQRKRQFLQLLSEQRKNQKGKIDKKKELEVAILKDKEKNRLKYNFLKLKNLTEEQIYKDFQDFQFDFDTKSLGNEYLEESKGLGKRDKMFRMLQKKQQIDEQNGQERRVQTKVKTQINDAKVSISSQFQKSDRHLKNLKEEKQKGQQGANIYKQKIAKILRDSESKSKILQKLSFESQSKYKNIINLKQQLKISKQYDEFLKIEKNIDSDYLQFLKAKILALGLQLND